tara:strand:+ start:189 stop:311 length:123 start_codon:yes stop_codon:yes gene_type:complete
MIRRKQNTPIFGDIFQAINPDFSEITVGNNPYDILCEIVK